MPKRCGWPDHHEDLLVYHDEEWGRPTTDANRLFEKVCLEGFQSGLSWLTILRKRERFREVFAAFDFEVVAEFGEREVELLLTDAGIIRHRGKIEATINNAKRAREMAEQGSLADWFWSWAVVDPHRGADGGIPATTPRSVALAKELKKMGWKFFGPTTAYAFMQSEGLTNDHELDCFVWEACEQARQSQIQSCDLRP